MASTPHYVAKKVGDDYQLVRTDPVGQLETPAYAVGGGAMFMFGFFKGGLSGSLMALGGLSMIYRGMTGDWPMCCADAASKRKAAKASQLGAATHQNDYKLQTEQRPQDEVDEASMESFPASDPPARMTPAPDRSAAQSARA